jgi:AcrR family transcriptional regulator
MEYNDKQLQIMEAAEQLFAEKGFAGTSVRDIADSAQVNLAMISYYFGSKEGLMEAMFQSRGRHLTMQLQTILENKSLSPFQKVEKLIEDYTDRIFRKQCFHKIMVREQMANGSGPISDQIFNLKQTNLSLVKQLIQEGQKAGDFKKNIDVPFLMLTLVGTTSQLVTTQYYYKKANNLLHLSDEEFEKHIRKKLNSYLKNLFKAMLAHEA